MGLLEFKAAASLLARHSAEAVFMLDGETLTCEFTNLGLSPLTKPSRYCSCWDTIGDALGWFATEQLNESVELVCRNPLRVLDVPQFTKITGC